MAQLVKCLSCRPEDWIPQTYTKAGGVGSEGGKQRLGSTQRTRWQVQMVTPDSTRNLVSTGKRRSISEDTQCQPQAPCAYTQCAYVFTYVQIYTYILTNTHAHTHTHTCHSSFRTLTPWTLRYHHHIHTHITKHRCTHVYMILSNGNDV